MSHSSGPEQGEKIKKSNLERSREKPATQTLAMQTLQRLSLSQELKKHPGFQLCLFTLHMARPRRVNFQPHLAGLSKWQLRQAALYIPAQYYAPTTGRI